MQVATVLDQRVRTRRIEGPTQAQAKKMAAYRRDLLRKASEALVAGEEERAFDLDCDAMDIEMDLINYGFTLAGRRNG